MSVWGLSGCNFLSVAKTEMFYTISLMFDVATCSYRFYVMVFTFVVYASFHMTRKAISVVQVKSTIDINVVVSVPSWFVVE